MTISIVIPAYNEEKYIGDCLRSILERAPENLKEIIVVNNASSDGTAAVAAQFARARVRVVDEPHKGITRARQRGFEESSGDLVACLDADTRMPTGWFEIVNREFNRDKNLVCLSGPFIYYDAAGFLKKLTKFWYRLGDLASMAKVTAIQGGNFVVRREALTKIGGFDTNIVFYGEDTNIGRRMGQVGRVKFNHDLFIYSSPRRLHSEGVIKTAFVYGLNVISELFFKKPATKKYRDIR